MTAIYPTHANVASNVFGVISTVTHVNTGGNVQFAMGGAVSFPAEAMVIIDGVMQNALSYVLANNNNDVSFYSPPNASELTIKRLSVPERYRVYRNNNPVSYLGYSNASTITVNSNVYIIDGARTAWALPTSAQVSSQDQILVTISGATQTSNAFTYPSATLGTQGIDISPAVEGLANNTLVIRTFNNPVRNICDRISSMADRKPDKGIQSELTFDVQKSESQSGYTKRRLRSRRPKRSLSLTYTNISGIEKTAIQNFYTARSGSYESFLFDLSHINESGTMTVTFEGNLQITQNIAKGDLPTDNFYTVSFALTEVFD